MTAPFIVDRFATGTRHEYRLDGHPTLAWALRRLYRAARRGGMARVEARATATVVLIGNSGASVTVVKRERVAS